MRRVCSVWTLTWVLCGLAGEVRPLVAAPPDGSAEERAFGLVADAKRMRGDGRFDEAVVKLEEAIRLHPIPVYVLNLARTLEDAGRIPEAVTAYERCLRMEPDPEIRVRARQRWAVLRDRLSSGTLRLRVSPEGAEVLVDGLPRGVAPLEEPLRLRAGQHTVEVRLPPRYETSRRDVDVPGGAEVVVDITLEVVTKTPPPSPPAKGEPWFDSTWGWVTFGSGVALLAGGGALAGVAEADREAIREDIRDLSSSSLSQKDAFERRDRADDMSTAGYVLIGVGGAAVLTSVVLFATHDGAGETAAEVEAVGFAPAVLPDGGGFVVSGRF